MGLQTLLKLIKKWPNAIIFTPKGCEPEDLEKNLALFYTLKKLGGDVNILIEKINQQNQRNRLFNSPASGSPANREYAISINTSDKEVTEMRYEKEKNRLNIFLTVKKGEIQDEDIVLKPPLEDQVKKPILLIAPDFTPSPKIKLLARALNKIEFEKKKQLYSISLTSNDFCFSNANQKDLGFILEELTTNTWRLPSLLLLWETHSSSLSIRGVFYTPKKDWLKKLLENFEGNRKGKGILFSISEKSLESAKEKILTLL